MKSRRLLRLIVETYALRPPSLTVLSSKFTRPRIVLTTDSGCSKISFCIKCEKEPFMISANSSSSVWIDLIADMPSSLRSRWICSSAKIPCWNTSRGNVAYIVVLQVEHALGVLDNCGRIGRHKKLDWLRVSIFAQKGTRRCPAQLGGHRGISALVELVLV